MTKFLLTSILLLPMIVLGQIQLDRTYSGIPQYIKMSSGEYWGILAGNNFKLYKVSDNILYKNITIPTIAGYTLSGYIYNCSEKLFDTDNEVEYITVNTNYNTTVVGLQQKTRICNEDGIVITEIPKSYGGIYFTNSGAKLLTTYPSVEIYNIGGNPINESLSNPIITNNNYYYYTTITGTTTVTSVVTVTSTNNNLRMAKIEAYPNPAFENITLSYSLPNGSIGRLIIIDNIGSFVRQIPVGADFNEIKLWVHDLPKGIYNYYIETEFGIQNGKKFVVE